MPTLDAMTLHEAKLALGIGGTSEDAQLARLITSVTQEAERRLGTQFVQRTVVELHEGGVRRIYPQVTPVVSVTSIVDQAANTVPATDYAVRQKKWLQHIGHFPIAYDANSIPTEWAVTYIAGWFATTEAVAADAKTELLRALATLRSVASQDPSLVSAVSVGDLSVSYRTPESVEGVAASNPVLDGAISALHAYRGVYL